MTKYIDTIVIPWFLEKQFWESYSYFYAKQENYTHKDEDFGVLFFFSKSPNY